jgi:hypothetical protein
MLDAVNLPLAVSVCNYVVMLVAIHPARPAHPGTFSTSSAPSKGPPARPDVMAIRSTVEGHLVAVCSLCCCCCCTGTAQLPPQQAYVTPLQLPPRQQQFRTAGSSGSSMQRMLAAAGTVGGVLGVQVGADRACAPSRAVGWCWCWMECVCGCGSSLSSH